MFQLIPFKIRLLFITALSLVLLFLTSIIIIFFTTKPVPTTTLVLSSSPTNASVIITGFKKTLTTPVEIPDLPLGSTVSLNITYPGYTPTTRAITLKTSPRQDEKIILKLFEEPTDTNNQTSEGLRIEQSPQYLEKIKKEPFWDILPYWSPLETFKIEYFQSNNYILISTFTQKGLPEVEFNRITTQYREDALEWIRENGGNPEVLPIRFDPQLL